MDDFLFLVPRCLERRLDSILYLLVKKPRREHAWQMPQGGLEEGETLLQVWVLRGERRGVYHFLISAGREEGARRGVWL